MADDTLSRCPWCGSDPLYVAYHDEEWGVPSFDDRHLFEKLCLEGQQAGLAWITVLRKRAGYRQAFHDFDVRRVAAMTDDEVLAQMANPGVIRHDRKLLAIRDNARAALAVQEEFGSLSRYFWGFVGERPLVNHWLSYREAPAATEVSKCLSRELKKRGFRFVGPTTLYAFMQGVGMVNDHETGCFRHQALA
jgi:DNA-3-methyladenine glycosylase I